MCNDFIYTVLNSYFSRFDIISCNNIKSGNINNSFFIKIISENTEKSFILQKINKNIFKNPVVLVENIQHITEHINTKIKQYDYFNYKNFNIHKTSQDTYFYKDNKGDYWRLLDYVNAKPAKPGVNPQKAYQAGKIIAFFHKILADLDTTTIGTTIKHFHQTDWYFTKFKEITANNDNFRLKKSFEIYDKIKSFSWLADEFVKISRILPLRIVHNDPKLDNILFDDNGNACTLIDLDTCMPGFTITDFADAVRSFANKASEDARCPDSVGFDFEIFRSLASGYLDENHNFITKVERKYMPLFVLIITFEQLIRFYNDYLQYDVYYKIEYKEHNLQRSRVQLKLLQEMYENFDRMKSFVNNYNKN